MRANPGARHREGDHRARRRRGAGLVPRRKGPPGHRRARVHPAAGEPDRPDHAGRAQGGRSRRRRSPASTKRRSIASRPTSGCAAAPGSRRRPHRGAARRRTGAGGGWMDSLKGSLGGLMTGSGRKDSMVEAMAKSAARTVGSTVGREIVRGVLGSLLGGRRRIAERTRDRARTDAATTQQAQATSRPGSPCRPNEVEHERLDRSSRWCARRSRRGARGRSRLSSRRCYGQADPGRSRRARRAPTSTAARCRCGTSRAGATPGEPRVRVLNPTLAEHGWQSTHTVVEIVNDDMPFLVDSVTMEVNRHGLALHLDLPPDRARRRARRPAATREPALDRPRRRRGGRPARIDDARRGRPRQRRRRGSRRSPPGISRVLADVRAAVEDWKPMLARLETSAADLERARRRRRAGGGRRGARRSCAGSPTTISRCSATAATISCAATAKTRSRWCPGPASACCASKRGEASDELRRAAEERARATRAQKDMLIVTKSNSQLDRPSARLPRLRRRQALRRPRRGLRRAPLPRPLHAHGLPGAPADIPLLRRKLDNVRARAGLAAGGHAAKSLANILDNLPARRAAPARRATSCYASPMGILRLGERQRFRLFVRPRSASSASSPA